MLRTVLDNIWYTLYPSSCVHCDVLLSGILCKECFSLLSFSEPEYRCPACFRTRCLCSPNPAQGMLCKTVSVLERTPIAECLLYQSITTHDRLIIQLFTSLLVIQVSRLNLPWCDAFLFAPKNTLNSRASSHWEILLQRSLLCKPLTNKLLHKQPLILYLVDWRLRSPEFYTSLVQDLLPQHQINILAISLID